MTKYIILLYLLLLPFVYASGQDIVVNNSKISFGKELKSQKNSLWSDDGRIESNYKNIEVYEGESITGEFYNGKLLSVTVYAYNNTEYPVCDEVEAMIKDISPLKQFTKFDEIGIFVETFLSGDFYIVRESSRMNTNYIIIPVKLLEVVRKTHSDYLNEYF